MQKRQAAVVETQNMLDLLPHVTHTNIRFVIVAASCIRAMSAPSSSGSENENLWTFAFPSAPGLLSGAIPDLATSTTNSFLLANRAAKAQVARMLGIQARLEKAKKEKKPEAIRQLNDDLKIRKELVQNMAIRLQDNVFEGCRITVYAPGSRRVLLQTAITKYDPKKNEVRIVQRLPERLTGRNSQESSSPLKMLFV